MEQDIYELINEELKDMGVCHVDRFAPYFTISTGAHIFNLRNKYKIDSAPDPLLIEGGQIPDTRLHIMFVTPPGGGKTFWLEKYLQGQNALLANTGVGLGMRGPTTEAGFVGTYHIIGGEKVEEKGICKIHMYDIVGVEEFAAITTSMQAEHSKTLDTQVLYALDHGRINKKLGSGDLQYTTRMTLWTGSQAPRLDLRGGASRRFIFLTYVPTIKDRELMCKAYENIVMNQAYKPTRLDMIRKGIVDIRARINKELQRVEYDPLVFEWFKHLRIQSSWEMRLYGAMIIGYQIMRGRFDNVLRVTMDDEIKNLILGEIRHRANIQRGMEYSEVLLMLRACGGRMTEFKFKEEMIRFGRNWDQSLVLLSNMLRHKAVKRDRTTGDIVLSPHLMKEGLL